MINITPKPIWDIKHQQIFCLSLCPCSRLILQSIIFGLSLNTETNILGQGFDTETRNYQLILISKVWKLKLMCCQYLGSIRTSSKSLNLTSNIDTQYKFMMLN